MPPEIATALGLPTKGGLVTGLHENGPAAAAAYDPSADTWRSLPAPPLGRRSGGAAVWEAAGDLDVRIGGGPTVVRDFLAADLIDTLHVVQVPILLGRGVRLWDGVEGVEERYDIEAVSSPSGVTHLTFTRR